MKKEFYSNGKLLITSEYVVLDGAQALALPTKFGQSLIVTSSEIPKNIKWTSFDYDGSIWFETIISFSDIINKTEFDDDTIKSTLVEILHHAYLLNPDFLNSNGFTIETKLTFPKKWGLGTSSTLINNIAQWLKLDAFVLLKNSFGGSGYDVACAQHNKPILYQLIDGIPKVDEVIFNPEFKENIYFVYLNQKQNSKEAIKNYVSKNGNASAFVPKFTELTQKFIQTKSVNEFSKLISFHEIELSSILEMQTIQEALFSDFKGIIKSLGAWGGDFVMVISEKDPTNYFSQKGFETILNYNDMIL